MTGEGSLCNHQRSPQPNASERQKAHLSIYTDMIEWAKQFAATIGPMTVLKNSDLRRKTHAEGNDAGRDAGGMRVSDS